MKNKKAKFFCENCGEEVPEKAKICTHCGKFFTNVRCPKCGHQGNHRDFSNGCPNCGYSKQKSSILYSNNQNDLQNSDGTKNIFLDFIDKTYSRKSKKKNYSNSKDNSLPAWIYIFTSFIFIGIVIAFYSCLIS